MQYDVEFTDEFGGWWEGLTADEQDSVAKVVGLLELNGPALPHPHSSKIRGSRHSHMRELRVQHGGRPMRVFYAFDPRRVAILLIAADKTGDDRFYERMIPKADDLYDEHLTNTSRAAR